MKKNNIQNAISERRDFFEFLGWVEICRQRLPLYFDPEYNVPYVEATEGAYVITAGKRNAIPAWELFEVYLVDNEGRSISIYNAQDKDNSIVIIPMKDIIHHWDNISVVVFVQGRELIQ